MRPRFGTRVPAPTAGSPQAVWLQASYPPCRVAEVCDLETPCPLPAPRPLSHQILPQLHKTNTLRYSVIHELRGVCACERLKQR